MNKVFYLIVAFTFLAADQLSKWAVTQHMIKPALGEEFGMPLDFWTWLTHAGDHLPPISIDILPFFNIVMVWNRGVSFGMFNSGELYTTIALCVLAIIIIIFFTIWMFKADTRWQSWAIALVIGGALGNVLDRIRFGAVIDFLDVHAFGWHWPAFNISDSCVVIGVFMLIFQSFLFGNRRE